MSFGEKLKQIREKRGLQQKDVAQKLSLKAGNAISNYEINISKPHLDNFIKLCKLFNVDANYFLEEELSEIINNELPYDVQLLKNKYDNLTHHDKEIVDYILNMKSSKKTSTVSNSQTIVYRFPTYDQTAAAGVGILNNESSFYMEEYSIDNIPDRAAYAMKISGDSMYSEATNYKIKTNSIVFVNPKFTNSELENRIVIVNFNGKTICKRYITENDYVLFKSDNDDYESENRKSTDDPNCKILGIVLGVIENEKFISL